MSKISTRNKKKPQEKMKEKTLSKEEKARMICVCGHNKLYHENSDGSPNECMGICNCKEFVEK